MIRKLCSDTKMNKVMIGEYETQPIELLIAYLHHTCQIHRGLALTVQQ